MKFCGGESDKRFLLLEYPKHFILIISAFHFSKILFFGYLNYTTEVLSLFVFANQNI